jgi:UDP-N-acetylmuramoyl-tripeptide--D-alanyl-D-alanine ligase
MIKPIHLLKTTGVESTCGKLPEKPKNFCADTRKLKEGDVFFAYPGEKVNPFKLLQSALRDGLECVVYEVSPENNQQLQLYLADFESQCCFIGVQNIIRYTQQLALAHTREWRANKKGVLAISGSNGKTTHKEMLSFLLKKVLGEEKVISTQKNNNNHLGVPMTLLLLNPKADICVLELGSNHPGEIEVLCDIAEPNMGLVTNIGATHLEFFGDEEAVFKEEGTLFHSMLHCPYLEKRFFQNLDDKFLAKLPKQTYCKSFSFEHPADYSIELNDHGARITMPDKRVYEFTNEAIVGKHNFMNMSVCLSICYDVYPQLMSQFVRQAQDFRPTPNRSESKDWRGKKVFLDAYNANPSSMKVALKGFVDDLLNKKCSLDHALFILGDMNELGEKSELYHEECGRYLKSLGAKNVVFIGRFTSFYIKGFAQGNVLAYEEAKQTYKDASFKTLLERAEYIFIKASRSLQLESILDIT